MRLRIAAVGRLKEAHWRAAAEEYLKRLRPYATVEVAEISDRDISYDASKAMAAEGRTSCVRYRSRRTSWPSI